ncbi:MAG: hypothetical protein ACRDM1_08730 [Gaiellaceae bacterium]
MGREAALTETIHVEVDRRGVGSDLAEVLAAQGLHAELVEGGEAMTLRIRFADDERERLLADATRAIESYLSERMLPLVVERADGGCVVRPPAD